MASRQSEEEHCSDYSTILKKRYPSETVSIGADILSDNPAGTMFVELMAELTGLVADPNVSRIEVVMALVDRGFL